MKNFNIIPAIDIIGGQCVRLTQGDYTKEKVYSDNPVEVAKSFERAGATRLHLVDLEGAKESCPKNLDVLRNITRETGLKVEFGGGVKSEESLKAVLDAGAEYVICGSVAFTEPGIFKKWLEEYGRRIILGLDLKNGLVATHGWKETVPMSAVQALESFGGLVRQAIVTEVSRDGMLQGVNLEFYSALQQQFPEVEIIVSGGVSSYEDLTELKKFGLRSAIVGKAIYEGRVKLEDLFR